MIMRNENNAPGRRRGSNAIDFDGVYRSDGSPERNVRFGRWQGYSRWYGGGSVSMDAVADAERVGRFQSYAFRQRVKRTLARKRADAARQHDVGEARAVRVELLLVNVAKKLSDRDPMEILGNLPAGRGMVLMMTEANRRVKGPETFAQCPFTLTHRAARRSVRSTKGQRLIARLGE